MVNADRSKNCVEMGALAVRKHEQNGSAAPSLFSKQIDTGSRVYKLSIHIEKIRPKPCPKSKKLAFLTEARRLEQLRAGISSGTGDQCSVSPKIPAACLICKQVFQSAQSLYLHKKKQHCCICSICNTEFATKALCESHEKMHESSDPVLPYKCHICSEKFDSKGKTRLHVRVIHTLVESKTGKSETPATRDSPRSDAPHRNQMAQLAERVGDLENSEKMGEKSEIIDERSTASNYSGVTFTCKACSKEFATVEAAEAHTMDHMNVVSLHKCSICKKLCKSETSLNDHLAEHLSRALRCPVCPKAFINRATLRIHMKSHGQGSMETAGKRSKGKEVESQVWKSGKKSRAREKKGATMFPAEQRCRQEPDNGFTAGPRLRVWSSRANRVVDPGAPTTSNVAGINVFI